MGVGKDRKVGKEGKERKVGTAVQYRVRSVNG